MVIVMKKCFLKKWLSITLVALCLITFTACETDVDTNGVSSLVSSEAQSVVSAHQDGDKVSESHQNTPAQSNIEVGNGTAEPVKISDIPAYSGKAYVIVNNNLPNFSADELTTTAYESYSDLDSFGRCGVAIASCGTEIMPAKGEKRGSISSIKPSGWVQAKYEGVSGGYLWNRCHLIGWQLSAENANKKNLITGTRYMNVEGMLVFENMVADYILETGNHVAYRITPIYKGNNLVCSGVQMEGYSIEDKGDGILFNVYCYNVQPGITINYATGESSGQQTEETSAPSSTVQSQEAPDDNYAAVMVWISKTGKKYHSKASCSNMKNPSQVDISVAKNSGLDPCSKCY